MATKTVSMEVENVSTEQMEKKVSKAKVSNNSLNKDGFHKGEAVSEKDYFTYMAKQRNKK